MKMCRSFKGSGKWSHLAGVPAIRVRSYRGVTADGYQVLEVFCNSVFPRKREEKMTQGF